MIAHPHRAEFRTAGGASEVRVSDCPPDFDTKIAARLGQPAATGKEVIASQQAVVADVGFPADLASADELLGLAVATRSTRPDHPSPSRAAYYSHTSTSQRAAIRRCTNRNGGLPK